MVIILGVPSCRIFYNPEPFLFSAIFTKGNNFRDFLFASLDNIALPTCGLHFMERICSKRRKSFPLRVDSPLREKQQELSMYKTACLAHHLKNFDIIFLTFS